MSTEKTYIPQHIVQSFLDGVQFKTDSELDVATAENVAAMSYASMETLVSTCKENMNIKYVKDFDTYVAECKEEDAFKPYFK